MKLPITEWLSTPWATTLGWTLLHSLWQALLILGLARLLLRYTPLQQSGLRYNISLVALSAMAVTSIATFIFLYPTVQVLQSPGAGQAVTIAVQPSIQKSTATLSLQYVTQTTQQVMPYVVAAWLAGTLLFCLRIAGGWLQVKRLQEQATYVLDDRFARLTLLARRLGIYRNVQLAVSARIHVPIVLGFIKPVILFPAGLWSGIGTAELDAILVHELTHIRRHDYLVNLIQSVLESIFFFNPFVWMMSGQIRTEREHCCDDTVVAMCGNPLAYAKVLAHLEEARLTPNRLAIGLAKNKNQLLTRIKRIMEKTVTPYKAKDRIIPALLVIVGLVCASWLTLKPAESNAQAKQKSKDKTEVPQDTVRKKSKSGSYSRKTVVRYDEKGTPHEEVVEEFDGDEDLRPLLDEDYNTDFDFEPFEEMAPLAELHIPEFDLPMIEDLMPPLAVFEQFDGPFFADTIKRGRNAAQWEAFGKEFESHFKDQFGDFYKEHQKEFEKMMQDIQKTVEKNASRYSDEEMMRAKEEMMHVMEMQRAMQHEQQVMQKINRDQLMNQEWAKKQQEMAMMEMQRAKEMMEAQQVDMQRLQQEMKVMQERMELFQEKLTDELVKDGYVKKGESIKTIDWSDDDVLKVNGVKIKDKDKQKYIDLRRQFFHEGGRFRFVE